MTHHYDFSATLARQRQQELLHTAKVGRIARLVRRNRRTQPDTSTRPSRDPTAVPIAQTSPSPVAAPTTSPFFDAQTA